MAMPQIIKILPCFFNQLNFKVRMILKSHNIIIQHFYQFKVSKELWLFSAEIGFYPVWLIWEVKPVFQAGFPLLIINQQSIPRISLNSSSDALHES